MSATYRPAPRRGHRLDEQTVPRHLTHLARTTGLGELRTAVPSHAKAILGRIGVILALVGAGCAGFGWWLLSPGEPWYDGIVFYVVGLIPFGFGVTMFVLRRRVRPEWLCIHDGGLVHQPETGSPVAVAWADVEAVVRADVRQYRN